jgi:hypothetical protein
VQIHDLVTLAKKAELDISGIDMKSKYVHYCSSDRNVLIVDGPNFVLLDVREPKILYRGVSPRRENFERCWVFSMYLQPCWLADLNGDCEMISTNL